jgi:hypothetical protein
MTLLERSTARLPTVRDQIVVARCPECIFVRGVDDRRELVGDRLRDLLAALLVQADRSPLEVDITAAGHRGRVPAAADVAKDGDAQKLVPGFEWAMRRSTSVLETLTTSRSSGRFRRGRLTGSIGFATTQPSSSQKSKKPRRIDTCSASVLGLDLSTGRGTGGSRRS